MVNIQDFLFGAPILSLDETYFLWIHNQVRKLHIQPAFATPAWPASKYILRRKIYLKVFSS